MKTPPPSQFSPPTPPETQQQQQQQQPAMPATASPNRAWWKQSTVYQIYPSSFLSSPTAPTPGVGDIRGITSKLPYLHSLGIDVVWVCPIYSSPQVDMGYDISDYKAIDSRYGSLEDVDELIKGCHERGMKLVMDLVVNHTSDQHEWFKSSISSRASEKRDWYIWKKPRYVDGKRLPPNNWISCFGGSAWEYDGGSGEYYLHLFAKEQPDLNWENPLVVDAVHDVVRFWLDRGVDGFRMDVINLISKHPGYPDAPLSLPPAATDPVSGIELREGGEFFANGPRLHEFLQGIGRILERYGAFSVGEMPWVRDESEVLEAVGHGRGELNMIFHFEIVDMDHGPAGKYSPKPFELRTLKKATRKWQEFMYENGGWNALYLENHDQSRTVSRYCGIAQDTPVERRHKAASMLATYLGGQAGTLFIYQGQELGMGNVPPPPEWDVEHYRDLEVLNHWRYYSEVHKDSPEMLQTLKEEYMKKSRDNARTPMQWDSSPNAGFCKEGVEPWIGVKPEYTTVNAEAQVNNEGSAWNYWRRLLQLRKDKVDELIYGSYETLTEELENDEDVLAYVRDCNGNRVLVVCNWKDGESRRDVKVFGEEVGRVIKGGKVLLGNYGQEKDGIVVEGEEEVVLRPFEAFVMQL